MYYEEWNRGKIQNEERAKQIIDFSGIRFGNITPTDLDGLIEYKNCAYVLMEFKHGNTELPYGQRLALTRMIDDFDKAGKCAALLICEHCVDDPHENIIAADASVRRYYFRGRWYPAVDREFTGRNVLQTIKNFLELAERMNKLF